MSIYRIASILICATLLCFLMIPLAAAGSPDEDLKTMQDLENATRQKSIALLTVLKSMQPELEDGIATVTMASIVSVSCDIREARGAESRIILNPNLNDEFKVIDQDDDLIRLDLGDGRNGWLDQSHLQQFELEVVSDQVSYYGIDPQQAKRYAIVTDELMTAIDDDVKMADEIMASYIKDSESEADSNTLKSLRGAHAQIREFESYARHFHQKYILNHDFSLENKQRFLDNLSAWGELLVGQSSFTTTTINLLDQPKEEKIEGDLRQISFGGDLEINEKSTVRASYSNKKEVNQTPYSTNEAKAGYSLDLNATTNLDLSVDTYAYADEINEFNNFRRTSFRGRSIINQDNKTYNLAYTNTSQGFEDNDNDDYTNHGLDLSGQWKRGRAASLNARLLADFESSDASFHNFKHLTPSLEYSKRSPSGLVRWRALYEMLDYKDAKLRSFSRAQISYNKSSKNGPRRNTSNYSLAHKDFPDNPLSTYIQLRLAWNRNYSAMENKRSSISLNTNFFPDNQDNSYTDVRLGRGQSNGRSFRNINLFTRLWHKPGEDGENSVAKLYLLDVYAKFGLKFGKVRVGPTLGIHMMGAKGHKIVERDGNLLRVGAQAEGTFDLGKQFKMTLNASYDYGFVYSDEFEINNAGNIITDETVQRHPTTFQINASASKPLSNNFDLTTRLSIYKISTDLNNEITTHPVTNNDRFTLHVGLRYRHN